MLNQPIADCQLPPPFSHRPSGEVVGYYGKALKGLGQGKRLKVASEGGGHDNDENNSQSGGRSILAGGEGSAAGSGGNDDGWEGGGGCGGGPGSPPAAAIGGCTAGPLYSGKAAAGVGGNMVCRGNLRVPRQVWGSVDHVMRSLNFNTFVFYLAGPQADAIGLLGARDSEMGMVSSEGETEGRETEERETEERETEGREM